MKGNKGMFVQISKAASRGLKLRFRCQEGNREMFLDVIKHFYLKVLIKKCQTATPEITEVVKPVVQIHTQFKRLLALIRTV